MIDAVRLGAGKALSLFNLQVCAVLTLVAAVAGPFGTYDLGGLGTRLLFWLDVVAISSILGHISTELGRKICSNDRPFLADAVMVGLMTVTFTPILWWLIGLFFGRPGLPLPRAAVYVALITAAVAAFRRIVPGLAERPYFWRQRPPEPPRLARRLPEGFEGEVLRITVRDHFVDIVTTSGVHSLRLRFADAVEETEPLEGFCTHRSHWVARRAIAGVEREDGRVSLRLTNGDLVPVSRSFRPTLEQAGLV